MAKLKNAKANIERALSKLLTPGYLRKIGKFAADMVQKRTQLGYGVPAQGAAREKLKPLSGPYKVRRRDMKLNENTSPSKSNLTRTGQLLSSLGVKAVSGNTVTIGPQGTRDDGLENAKLAEYVTEQGRPFNFLSDVELKRLREKVRKDLQAELKKALVKIRK